MIKIFINPGHGQPDPGAVGPSGLTEAEVALSVGDRAAEYLREVGYKVRVLQSDYLGSVIQDANVWDADLFLSIHCNSFDRPSANGTETIYHQDSSRSKKFAQSVQNQLISEFGLVDRGIKTMASLKRELGVLSKTAMPACLAEMAFISNPEEEQLLASEQDRWAKALARGVSDYFA